MGANTERAKLYMPGGGSQGLGGDDESADIDKLNENSMLLDKLIGARPVASPSASITPSERFDGMLAKETATGQIFVWDASRGTEGQWIPADRVWRSQGTPVGTRRTGDVWISWE